MQIAREHLIILERKRTIENRKEAIEMVNQQRQQALREAQLRVSLAT